MITEKQKEIVDVNSEYVEVMAKSLWDANQIVDHDPMHPQWKFLDDPIKDDYRKAVSIAVLANNGESVDVDLYPYKECIGQLINLLESGFDHNNYYHTDSVDDAKKLIK